MQKLEHNSIPTTVSQIIWKPNLTSIVGKDHLTINHNRGGVGRIVPPQRLGGGFGRVKEAQGEENFSADQGEEDSTSDVFNQQEQMDFLSRHKFREILPLHNTEYIKQFREASPTHKLKKKLKQQYYQSYPSYEKLKKLVQKILLVGIIFLNTVKMQDTIAKLKKLVVWPMVWEKLML
uniref:Uncharacterized protein n=1 Tax=Tenebrio molitor TaxID=7067 RepID=A0A8J6GXS7_TENMO|nr:hypothetical protein GEV33_014701 [Tenebrio molitor]